MDGSHHVNLNSIIYKKGSIQRTKIESPFLAVKDFNTNFVQFLDFYWCSMLLLVTCKSALLRLQFPMCMNMHLKRFCVDEMLCMKGYNLWKSGQWLPEPEFWNEKLEGAIKKPIQLECLD